MASAVVLAAALLAAAAASLEPASAHRDPCHPRHACPSDHHTYAWRGLVCTSYADERLPSDTTTVSYGGRTYWCHGEGAPGSAPGKAPRSSSAACGVERWAVKTLSDEAAASVSFQPRATTVEALRRAPAPAVGADTPRIPGAETTTYRVRAALVAMRLEDDRDIHLVIADPASGGTMIVELADPGCSGAAGSARRAEMRQARAALIAACGPPGEAFTRLRGAATIAGVGFFDLPHGQIGVAPNGIELHPVLAFEASSCRRL